jgi:hypothetical protein
MEISISKTIKFGSEKKITRNQRTENNISNILKRLNVIDEFKRIHEYYKY